ncbi:MAG: transcriptional regulator [bacterium]|nr:transcriptional regulator [bacterium]
MHLYNTTPAALIKQPAVCAMLSLSRSGLDKLRKRDPSFPPRIKDGDSRQAAVYYVLAEVEAWINAKMAARNGEAA